MIEKIIRYLPGVLLAVLLSSGISAYAQKNNRSIALKWNDVQTNNINPNSSFDYLNFDNAGYDSDMLQVPYYYKVVPVAYATGNVKVMLSEVESEPLSAEERSLIQGLDIDYQNSMESVVRESRGENFAAIKFYPFIVDENSGAIEKITSFRLNLNESRIAKAKSSTSFVQNSVMATGDWYKIGLTEDGIFRLNYEQLEDMGIDMEVLDPYALNIFGNSFGQLPYENSEYRPDDLLCNAIDLVGDEDGTFDPEDYILFYAKGPHSWTYNSSDSLFEHSLHVFSDTSYYFVGINTAVPAKRISTISSGGSASNFTSMGFNDYAYHELERKNLIQSGRQWLGEEFDVQTTYNFSGDNYNFPNIQPQQEVNVNARFVSKKSTASSSFILNVNGNQTIRTIQNSINKDTEGIAAEAELSFSNSSSNLNVNITYQKATPSSVGWLDWFEINVRRQLKMSGAQMDFRDVESVGPGRITNFTIDNADAITQLWDVTDPSNARAIQYNGSGNTLSFTMNTEVLREFIAFTNSGFKTAEFFGQVENQDLHAIGINERVDMVVVSPGFLIGQAEALADLHRNHEMDPLNVVVVDVQKIYNEFSSGMRDATAIKWFMKMLYDRADGNEEMMPRYLCLFGDGSYDNKSIGPNNSNLLPTYQSLNSLITTASYVSDDYFGLLSDDEGEAPQDFLDLGIGRFPIKNIQEAQSSINKVNNYINVIPQNGISGISNLGDWRNKIVFVADDKDNNRHMDEAEQLADTVNANTNLYNIDKVFLDAYQAVATPGGARFPEANKAIDRAVQNGVFIINYTGHGGEVGWAEERILNVPTIQEWENTHSLPLFITATCEFSRFDDPVRTSAGEFVFLNGTGGGIALLTTTRLVYSGDFFNLGLNKAFYKYLFHEQNAYELRLGDFIMLAKRDFTNSNSRNFTLIGDPAIKLAVPKHRIEMTALTDTMGNPIDTLKALGVARVRGVVNSQNGELLSDFNGYVKATVFDRKEDKSTLGNSGETPFNYQSQERTIYKGNARVENGEFQFDFVLPKDISYLVDTTAKISFYAYAGMEDARGVAENLTIGSRDENAVDDGEGPQLNIFMNDENFVFGGITSDEPILLANIFDQSGINTVGNGIGHDISAILDENTSEVIVLNDYYESDLDTYKSGQVKFPFDELPVGNHSLKVKVWDVHNNSTEAYLEFIVANSEEFAIDRVLNYPNPFTTNTQFFFEHNEAGNFLNVQIQIYTVSGKLVKTINTISNTNGFRNEPIHWDGRDDFGDRIGRGVYVYRVSVRNPAGDKAEKIEKLVILN